MDISIEKRMVLWKYSVRTTLILVVLGFAIYGFEHWGDQYMSRLATFVAEQGRLGIVIFIAVNALATMFLVPQSVFTVAAGALFGWKFGTAWASVGMTLGATGSFLIARYGLRDWLRNRFAEHRVYRKMQRLSVTHPLHVISLSRLIPIIPFPVASYLLGVTEVRSMPYALLTWACMFPETLFLASGGHLLHAGIAHGRTSVEAVIVLAVAGIGLGVVAHRMKKKFLESEDVG